MRFQHLKYFAFLLLLGLSAGRLQAQCAPDGAPHITLGRTCGIVGQTIDVPIIVNNFGDVFGWNIKLCVNQPGGFNLFNVISQIPGQTVSVNFGSLTNPDIGLQFNQLGSCNGHHQQGFADGTIIAIAQIAIFETAEIGSCISFEPCITGLGPSNVSRCLHGQPVQSIVQGCYGEVCALTDIVTLGGTIRNYDGDPVPGVDVANSINGTVAVTDQNGYYEFPNLDLNGNTSITLSPSRDDSENYSGITHEDADTVADYIWGDFDINCYQMIAADANNSLLVTSFDWNAIHQASHLMYHHWVGLWEFIPKNVQPVCDPATNSVAQQIQTMTISCPQSATDLDFIAIKLGDVTMDATAKRPILIDHMHADIAVSPNPFSDNVSLKFSLEDAQEVTVNVYDVSGKLIHTATEFMESGLHKIGLQTREWPQGVLLYEVNAPQKRLSGRFLHLSD